MILASVTQVLVGPFNQEKALVGQGVGFREGLFPALICIECRDQVHVIPRQIQHLTGGMQNPATETGAWCLFCNGEARLVH